MITASKYNKTRRAKILKVFEAFILGLLSVTSIMLLTTMTDPISTDDADALYGGNTNIDGYASAGYIVDYSSVFTRQVCGITYLSETAAISAAHCFQEDGIYYVGNNEFSTTPDVNLPIGSYFLHPNWDPKTLKGDIAYITLSESVNVSGEYAEVATPLVGCNYEVLAYGSREEYSLSNTDLRRSAMVCIEAVTDDRFYLRSPDGGVCFGDSGSPVFVKDTNKIVGIISAITYDKEAYSTDNCFVNNQAVATRADEALRLVNMNINVEEKTCPIGSETVCKGKEVCRSNRCMAIDDFVYISALDYRSADYALSGLSSTAGSIILALSSIFFSLVLWVRIKGTMRLSV